MNRVIKFRAWDDVRKKFFTSPEWVDFKVYACGTLLATNIDRNCKEQDLVVMQFTGLHDVDGVEIYEGDICTWYINDLERIGEVYYHGQSFEMRSPSMGYIGWDAGRGEIKVIGNIYENGNLLK